MENIMHTCFDQSFSMHAPNHKRKLPAPLFFAVSLLLFTLRGACASAAPSTQPTGDTIIRGRAGDSEIVITTTSRLAGAIHSLTWNGKEFIDSADHGRQLQSAAGFDFPPGMGKRFNPEAFNPTEAGSRDDGAGGTSTSKLVKMHAAGNTLETTTQMAFWLKPGEKSSGDPARNKTALSEHLLSKRVTIGYKGLPHAIQYDVTFTVPRDEAYTYACFEALTGYMPPEFDRFWKMDAETKQLEPLDAGPGEQAKPVALSTADGKHAMGVFSPDQPARGFEHAGYGRFKFEHEKVVKWNCAFRERGAVGGNYHYRIFVAVGTLEDVRRTIAALMVEFVKKN